MKQANFEHFKPFPLVTNGRLQTIVGHLLHLPRTLQSEQIKIPLGDGDQLSCELSFPKNWDSKTPSCLSRYEELRNENGVVSQLWISY